MMKIDILRRIGIAVLGFLITSLFTLAVNVYESNAEIRIMYTLTVENQTELYLTVEMRKSYRSATIVQIEVPPKSTRSARSSLPPGQYNVISTPKKCGDFLQSNIGTWVLTNQNQKKIILTDKNFSNVPIPPNCTERMSAADYSGKWICPGRGWLQLYQQDTIRSISITGTFGGKPSEDWGRHNVKGGKVKGKVEGDMMSIIFYNNDGTYTTTDVSLGGQKDSFSGKWAWYEGDGKPKGRGAWGCHR